MAKGVFEPMKAPKDTPETPEEIAKLHFPMYMSPKFDGIRMTNYGGVVSRTNKPLPSKYVQRYAGSILLGVDGEAICGEPTSPTVFSDTYSGVMTHGSMTPVSWYVFDLCHPNVFYLPYRQRLHLLRERVDQNIWHSDNPPGNIIVVEQKLVNSWGEVLEEEERIVALGYEGAMLRSPLASYKFGRSTLNENGLIKIKRFETCEARITGFYELMHNANEGKDDATGHLKRSSHKGNLIPGDTLGGFHVSDLESGVQFNLGSGLGLTADLRKHIWNHRSNYEGAIVSYKKLKVGEKDKPRNCTFRGFRSKIDL